MVAKHIRALEEETAAAERAKRKAEEKAAIAKENADEAKLEAEEDAQFQKLGRMTQMGLFFTRPKLLTKLLRKYS